VTFKHCPIFGVNTKLSAKTLEKLKAIFVFCGEPLTNSKRLGLRARMICFNDSPSERPSKSI